MMRNSAWIADYPDGDNFMQLLYGPNTQQSNNACYQSPEFDRLYEKSKTLPDGPERNKLYWAMGRKMEADTAWIMNDSRVRNMLMQPRVIGYKRHPTLHQEWMWQLEKSSERKIVVPEMMHPPDTTDCTAPPCRPCSCNTNLAGGSCSW